jgi:gliding motility-associated-like protein
MKRILKKVFLSLLFIIIGAGALYSQEKVAVKKVETAIKCWNRGVHLTRKSLGATIEEYSEFRNFYYDRISRLKTNFIRKVKSGKIDSSNIKTAIAQEVDLLSSLYNKFDKIKKEYPSTVTEYTNTHKLTGACNPSCTNIDFENGTLSGWDAYYAENTSTSSSFSVTGVVGGTVGSVTGAANDPKTIGTSSTGPDYQVEIMSGGNDPLVPSIPRVSPFGGNFSVRLGDSTNALQGVAILRQTFLVTAANSDFVYEYAVFLENPRHPYFEQPFFTVTMFDQNGDTITGCGKYIVTSTLASKEGFDSVAYPTDFDTVYYKPWSYVFVPLQQYIGQCVTIQFMTADCSLGAHFGYAYIDASCSGIGVVSSSPAFCGKPITLTGPNGAAQYQWTGPPGGIIGSNTGQTIKVDSAGTYKVIVTPYTGSACNDTLTIIVPKKTGPIPIPLFKADTACLGKSTTFTNKSSPNNLPATSYYWSFFNNGTINDSTTNPTWTYTAAGTYAVKLTEDINGCASDTVLKIKVDSIPVATVTGPAGNCAGDSITLKASGGGNYLWNTGATTSSISFLPQPNDTVYSLIVTKGCSDTAYHTIHVFPGAPINTCCDSTIAFGSSAPVAVTGSVSYVWSPANTLSCDTCAISVSTPSVTTVYTVTATDKAGCISTDSVKITIEKCANAWIPDAFTPNGDKIDDYFSPVGVCIYYYTMYIYDRWGNIIYKTTNSKPWDGTVNGKLAQEDTYVYQVLVTTTDFIQRTYLGSVTLLR